MALFKPSGVVPVVIFLAAALPAQTPPARVPTRADILRGEYGPYRANNDLLFYHLDIRVDPEKKLIAGKVTTRFKMLRDGSRIQLDLHAALQRGQDSLGRARRSQYERDSGAVFVDFPETLKAGRTYSIDFYYSGHAARTGRFGGFTFGKDPAGRPWIYTACEGTGASLWWPNKDQWRDEVENMRISVSIPNGLVDVSNGKFLGKTDLGDGYTRWDWLVQYPINNYDVALNIGHYEHFADQLGDLPLDFYALPEDLDKARKQFAQAKGMLEAYQHYFGEYPFQEGRIQAGRRCLTPAWNTRPPSPTATGSPTDISSGTGPAWASARGSTSSSSTKAAHEWFGNASPRPTFPICGSTKAGPLTWNACMWSTCWRQGRA